MHISFLFLCRHAHVTRFMPTIVALYHWNGWNNVINLNNADFLSLVLRLPLNTGVVDEGDLLLEPRMSFGPGDKGSTQYWHRQSFPLKVTLSPAGKGRLGERSTLTTGSRRQRQELQPHRQSGWHQWVRGCRNQVGLGTMNKLSVCGYRKTTYCDCISIH